MADPSDWMVIGEIAGPFGVHGEVKVQPLTDFPERFDGLRSVYVGDDHREYAVERMRRHKQQVLLTLRGVGTPEQVERLRHRDVAVPRDEAVPLPEGHYFLDDLIGVDVVTPDGTRVGPITDVLRTGSNDVYVVNSGKDAVLIPAIKDAVTDVDLGLGRIVVEPWVLSTDE